MNQLSSPTTHTGLRKSIFLLLLLGTFTPTFLFAQLPDSVSITDYSTQADYEVGDIKVSGAEYSDEKAIVAISGLKVGDKIRVPGPEIPRAIKALWNLRLFTDVQILKTKAIGEVIFLEIHVQERPRLTKHSFKGAKKSHHDDLNEQVDRFLVKGGIVTENVKARAAEAIKDYYRGKGFLDTEVVVKEIKDESRTNAVRLEFDVDRKERIKIQDIVFKGNESLKAKKLRKQMEETKPKRKIFSSSKLIKPDYEADKKKNDCLL